MSNHLTSSSSLSKVPWRENYSINIFLSFNSDSSIIIRYFSKIIARHCFFPQLKKYNFFETGEKIASPCKKSKITSKSIFKCSLVAFYFNVFVSKLLVTWHVRIVHFAFFFLNLKVRTVTGVRHWLKIAVKWAHAILFLFFFCSLNANFMLYSKMAVK